MNRSWASAAAMSRDRQNFICELEEEKRGLYTGCAGYFSATGEMDSCIVLRTALVKDGKMYV